MTVGDHSILSSFSRGISEGEICFGREGDMKGHGKRINVPGMPLRLSIERKDAEVACMRLGGLNNSGLLSKKFG